MLNRRMDEDSRINIFFRPIEKNDFEEIRQLHVKLFPIQYSESFFVKASEGVGLYGLPLFSSIAVSDDGNICGFILAQFITIDNFEDPDLIDNPGRDACVCYILTLGLSPNHRRSGLGTQLLHQCENYALSRPDCIMVGMKLCVLYLKYNFKNSIVICVKLK